MPEYDVALELARLHIMKGADFIRQLKQLVSLSIFKPVENEKIYMLQKVVIVMISPCWSMQLARPLLMVI